MKKKYQIVTDMLTKVGWTVEADSLEAARTMAWDGIPADGLDFDEIQYVSAQYQVKAVKRSTGNCRSRKGGDEK
jgi:hypothetical protein